MKKEVFLLLGSNLGKREEYLALARHHISMEVGEVVNQSSVYETEPWGFSSETLFLNQAVKIVTSLSAFEILQKIKSIETQIGRVNSEKQGYSSRTIDIDILLFGNEVVNSAALIIPHSKLHQRLFALIPLAEVGGNVEHPLIQKTILTLLKECKDKMKVKRY